MRRQRHKHAFYPLPEEELRALTTPRLLAYQKRIRGVHETSWGDIDQEDERRRMAAAGAIRYKDEPVYAQHRALVRRILDERAHVPRTR